MKKQKIRSYSAASHKGRFKLAKAIGNGKYEDVLNRKGKPYVGSWNKINKAKQLYERKHPQNFFVHIEIR